MEIETVEKDEGEEIMPANIAKAIQIVGKKAPLKISKCCHPSLHDPIVGFYTKDKKITIHKKTCPNIHALDKNKEVPVLWTEERKLPIVKISLTLADKVGALARVLNIIASYKFNIKNITTRPRKDNVITTLHLEVDNQLKFKDLLNELRKIEAVININAVK